MKVRVKERTYETSDGQEFATQSEANKRQSLIDATEKYRNAKEDFGRSMAETQRTADDRSFVFGVFNDYWFIESYGDKPTLVKFDFIGREVELDGEDLYLIPGRYGHSTPNCRVAVKDLYADRSNARKAVVLELKKYMERIQDEIKSFIDAES